MEQMMNERLGVHDTISRKMAIDALNEYFTRIGKLKRKGLTKEEKAISLDMIQTIEALPPAQQETYKEKLNEIANALSEKFAYMNTCLNERDIILGYLGVKRSCKRHCNIDCTNTKCESHPLSSTQPDMERKKGKWIVDNVETEHCSVCKHRFYISALFAVGGNDEPPSCPWCGADMREEEMSK